MSDLKRADALSAEYDMLPSGGVVLCAVSGGADSMCLLHWLCRRDDLTVHAAHFDHALRGEESVRDSRFVRDWCRDHHIPFHMGTGDVAGEAKRRKMGVEETARAMRYRFLRETAARVGATVIATAHNAGDNAETVLMHLLRGAGLQGLSGMEPRRDNLIRPLLTTPRQDIECYLSRHHVPHVEDSSNGSDDLLRNKVRHQLVPLLEEWNPGFVDRMTAALPGLRADNRLLLELAQTSLQGAAWQGEELVADAPAVAQLPQPVAIRAARLLLAQAIGHGQAPDPPPQTDCSQAHLEALVSLARSEDPSGEICLPHGLTVRREYDRLIFTRGAKPLPLAPFAPVRGENPVPGTDWVAVLDADPWPGLVIRPRQEGDRIALPGRPRKPLKKLLIDQKVPRWERDALPVCADDDGVIAVAGLGPNLNHPRRGTIHFTEKEEKEHDERDGKRH